MRSACAQPTFEEQLMDRLPEEARAAFGEALMAGANELLEETLEELDNERVRAMSDLDD